MIFPYNISQIIFHTARLLVLISQISLWAIHLAPAPLLCTHSQLDFVQNPCFLILILQIWCDKNILLCFSWGADMLILGDWQDKMVQPLTRPWGDSLHLLFISFVVVAKKDTSRQIIVWSQRINVTHSRRIVKSSKEELWCHRTKQNINFRFVTRAKSQEEKSNYQNLLANP